jgi:cold shock CspA family protein
MTFKMWNAEPGFGFIAVDLGGPDMFLHVSVLQSVSLAGRGTRTAAADAGPCYD